MAKYAKVFCDRCESRLSLGAPFCDACGFPTPWASLDERTNWEVGQWRAVRTIKPLAHDKHGPAEASRPVFRSTLRRLIEVVAGGKAETEERPAPPPGAPRVEPTPIAPPALTIVRDTPEPRVVRSSPRGELRVSDAGFPEIKTLEDFDFGSQPALDPRVVHQLATFDFMDDARNVILTGPSGSGKTHLSIALGVRAAHLGHGVAFATADEWVARLDAARRRGTLKEELARLARVPLLIVDAVAQNAFDLDRSAMFFALVASRFGHRSTILTSDKTPPAWTERFADPAAVAQLVGRLVERSEVVTLEAAGLTADIHA